MKNKYFLEKSGITLIALVVTIVVLLILAGVSINMLTGQNRNFKESFGGKRKNEPSTKAGKIRNV